MRITVDASPLLVRSAGVKNYLYYWIRALRAHADVHLFPMAGNPSRLNHEAFSPLGLLFLHLSRHIGVDPFIGRSDIFHATNLVRKPPKKALLTATLHDLTAWRMPQLHTEDTRRAEQYFAANIASRAAGLIAVSESTRRDAIEILNLPSDRITVIHSGVADAFFTAEPARREKPYVLFVGTIEPRKNIEALLDAWQQVRTADYELVIAGPAGWGSRQTLNRVNEEATYLGYVPEERLPSLTAGASAFVYPSLYEGFGFPVAQALAAGVPVVTSPLSSLPEVAGDAALYADPHSASDIATALLRILGSPDIAEQLSRAGRLRAQAMFRWEVCARRSLDFFASLLR